MTPHEAVTGLDNLDVADPEQAHGYADEILLAFVPREVREAYNRVMVRAPWWAGA